MAESLACSSTSRIVGHMQNLVAEFDLLKQHGVDTIHHLSNEELNTGELVFCFPSFILLAVGQPTWSSKCDWTLTQLASMLQTACTYCTSCGRTCG